jgi:hypothetical protein
VCLPSPPQFFNLHRTNAAIDALVRDRRLASTAGQLLGAKRLRLYQVCVCVCVCVCVRARALSCAVLLCRRAAVLSAHSWRCATIAYAHTRHPGD